MNDFQLTSYIASVYKAFAVEFPDFNRAEVLKMVELFMEVKHKRYGLLLQHNEVTDKQKRTDAFSSVFNEDFFDNLIININFEDKLRADFSHSFEDSLGIEIEGDLKVEES